MFEKPSFGLQTNYPRPVQMKAISSFAFTSCSDAARSGAEGAKIQLLLFGLPLIRELLDLRLERKRSRLRRSLNSVRSALKSWLACYECALSNAWLTLGKSIDACHRTRMGAFSESFEVPFAGRDAA